MKTVIRDYIRNQEEEDKRLDQNEPVALIPATFRWPHKTGAALATPHKPL